MKQYKINKLYPYKEPRAIKKIIKYILKKESKKNSFISIIFCSDEKIQNMNKLYRGINKPTDVLSFNLNSKHLDKDILGDIYISIPTMKKQALEYNHSETRELSFLIVHGILHLMGYDHETKEDELTMIEKQEMILNEFKETKI